MLSGRSTIKRCLILTVSCDKILAESENQYPVERQGVNQEMSTIAVEVLSDGSLVLPATTKAMFSSVELLLVSHRDGSIVLTPQKRSARKKTLADYLQYLQTDNLLADAHAAKEKSHALFEDQGLATITLAVADALVGLLAEGRLGRPIGPGESTEK